MNRKVVLLTIVLLLFTATAFALLSPRLNFYTPPLNLAGPAVEDFTLWDHRGKSHNLRYYSDAEAIVLFSYGIGCPIARLSIAGMKELRDRYEPKGVKFFFLNGNAGDTRQAMVKEAEEYGIDFPVLMDEAQLVTRALGITRTAEVIVIDPDSWKIAYRGAVDDRLTYETQKEHASETYLAASLDSLLRNRVPEPAEMPVKGCLIHVEPVHEDVSYVKDVVPILRQRCLQCHYTGGAAPWAMDGYETVRNWGPMIRETVRTRRMPPRSLDPHYEKMKGTDWLSPEEARVIVDWVETGMTRGEGEDPLPAENKKISEVEWPWGEPDYIIESTKETEVLPFEWMDWTITFIENAVPEDVWVWGVYMRPSNEPVLHHSALYSSLAPDDPNDRRSAHKFFVEQTYSNRTGLPQYLPDPKLTSRMRASSGILSTLEVKMRRWWMDFQAKVFPEKSYERQINDFLAQAHTNGRWQYLSSYAPGLHPDPFPKGTGMFLPKGATFRFVSHYKPTGKPEKNSFQVGLYVYPKSEWDEIREIYYNSLQGNDFYVPAGEKNYPYSVYHTLQDDILLYGSSSHLHYRTPEARLKVLMPGENEPRILWSDPDYNYDFTTFDTRFEKPISLPKGSTLIFEGTFDNSAQNPKNPSPEKDAFYGYQRGENMFWTSIAYTLEG